MLSADSSAKDITVPRGLLEALRPQIEALGETLPGFDRIVPKVDLDLGVREMGMQLGGMLKNCGLYRKGISRRLVAMFADEGWKEMTPHRFPGWVEKFVTCYKNHRGGKGGYYQQETSMGKDLAAKVLETDDFLVQIPIIEHVVNVRAPVRRKDGRIELLRPGYDYDSQIWCDDAVPYRLDMTPAEAIDVINEYCCEFPYADMKQPFKKHAWTNRSFLVHVAGMLGVFNRFLLDPGVIRPLMMYFSNDQGSGKSILVAMVLASLYGIAANTDLPISGNGGLNQDRFTALLETAAQSSAPFLFLDDVPPAIFSNALNRFVTSPKHMGRKYGGNDEMFEVPAVTQVFVTGNNVNVTRDMQQRGLICELFLNVDAESVKHSHNMTAHWIGLAPQREKLLAALWAMTRHWISLGQPPATFSKPRAPEWSALVGGIMESLGVTDDPFVAAELPFSGDKQTDEMRKLLTALADDVEEDYEIWLEDQDEDKEPWAGKLITTTVVVEKARKIGVLIEVVGGPEEKQPPKAGDLRKLGRRLEKWRGKEDLRSSKGRRFRFGKRKQEHGQIYPIEWLDELPIAPKAESA